jgi:hypothetical protein
MLVFTVDRYFDYKDLLGTTILVQWKIGNTTGCHAIPTTLIDAETISGKLRFGWILTNEITNTAGKLEFSISFA